MNAVAINSRDQALAGALAFAMHVLLLVLLVFGVSWQQKQIDTAMVVDLWRDLPSVTPPKAVAPPPPAIKPAPPPPAPKVEIKPPPKLVVAPKPDIALREKLERERKLEEQQAAEAKKIAAQKAQDAEAEKKKRAAAEALKQKQAAEAKAERVAAEQQKARDFLAAQEAAEQQKARDSLAAQQAAAQAKIVDEYKQRILEKIKRFVVEPPNLNPNAKVEFTIVVLPGGEVLGAKLKNATNSTPVYEAAVERAILRAQPLPLPPDPALMRQFRELNLVFRP